MFQNPHSDGHWKMDIGLSSSLKEKKYFFKNPLISHKSFPNIPFSKGKKNRMHRMG